MSVEECYRQSSKLFDIYYSSIIILNLKLNKFDNNKTIKQF